MLAHTAASRPFGKLLRVADPAPAPDVVAVSLVALPGRCWRCGERTMPLVGVFVPRNGTNQFIEFSDVAARLAVTVPAEQLAELGIGRIKIRRSRVRPDGYLANGCVQCDAILGDHPLREDLNAFLSEGGDLHELVLATVPLRRRH